jgi:hypothetical protein
VLNLKRKNRQLSERLFKKPGSYNVFRSDWGFIRILDSVSFGLGLVSFGLGLVSFGLGFHTRPLALRIWISVSLRTGSDISFGLDVSKV